MLEKVVFKFISLKVHCISVSKPMLYCRLANYLFHQDPEEWREKERSRGVTIASEGEKSWLACLLVCGWETLFFTLRCPWYLGSTRADFTGSKVILMPSGPWRILFSGPFLYLPNVSFHHLVPWLPSLPTFLVAWVMAIHSFWHRRALRSQRNAK